MKLQVLVSTMNQTDYSLIDKMNIQCDAVIVNQCDKNSIDEFEHRGLHIKWICMKQRGVGLSRNTALFNAEADIVLFADDDMVYADGYAKAVLNAFETTIDADVICFNIDLINSNKNIGKHRNNTKIKRLHLYNSLRYGACLIAVRRKAILRERISFSLLYGGGAVFSAGEDSLFVCDCLRKDLKLYSHTYFLGLVEDSESSWYKGVNDKLFIDRGCLYATAFPLTHRLIYLYYAVRMMKYSENYNFRKIYSLFLEGEKIYKLYR